MRVECRRGILCGGGGGIYCMEWSKRVGGGREVSQCGSAASKEKEES